HLPVAAARSKEPNPSQSRTAWPHSPISPTPRPRSLRSSSQAMASRPDQAPISPSIPTRPSNSSSTLRPHRQLLPASPSAPTHTQSSATRANPSGTQPVINEVDQYANH